MGLGEGVGYRCGSAVESAFSMYIACSLVLQKTKVKHTHFAVPPGLSPSGLAGLEQLAPIMFLVVVFGLITGLEVTAR